MNLRRWLIWWLAPSHARPEARHELRPRRTVTVVIRIDTTAWDAATAWIRRTIADGEAALDYLRIDHAAVTYGDGWPT